MDLHEYFKKKGVIELRNGWDGYENLENILGNDVWICDYRLGSGGATNKPIRALKPKKVRIFSNDNLPKNKIVYFSPIHFREVSGNKILSAIIAPYDNTGYRCLSGGCVNIFESKEDCLKCYRKQIELILAEYDKEIARLNNLKFDTIMLFDGYVFT